jgi:hypothetical protein
MTDSDSPLTQGQLFDTLCNRRRLEIIRYLRTNGGRSQIGPVVDRVAARENGKSPDDLKRAERRRVYISIYQTHLPILEQRGIVSWNRDENVVRLLPDNSVEGYLDHGSDRDSPWHWYYLSTAVVSAATVSLWSADALPIEHLSASMALALVSATVLGIVLVRYSVEWSPSTV